MFSQNMRPTKIFHLFTFFLLNNENGWMQMKANDII